MSFLSTLNGHTYCVSSVAWSPDGQKIASSGSGSYDHGIKIWDVSNYEDLKNFNSLTRIIN